MAVHTPPLDRLRVLVQETAGGFLRNSLHMPGVTCGVCTGITKDGWPTCYACSQRLQAAGLADRLGFVIYGWNGGQAGRTMYAYKSIGGGPTSHDLVSAMLAYAVVAHWPCIAREASLPDGWAIVPSLSGRTGSHPLAGMSQQFLGKLPHVPVHPAAGVSAPRGLHPQNFVVPGQVSGHVLLLDDTWTTGGHLQSASAALKAAGAERVTGLAVARWLDPTFAGTQAFIDGLVGDFEPLLCPYTGALC